VGSVATLVHAFVADRIDYCVGLLAGSLDEEDDMFSTQLHESCQTAASTTKD